MKKAWIIIFLFSFSVLFAQRNEQVRRLNDVIDFMDEASRMNMLGYWDAKTFGDQLTHNLKKRNDYLWYVHDGPNIRLGIQEEDKRFPEISPDAEGYISEYESDLLPYLRAKEKVMLWIQGKNQVIDLNVYFHLSNFMMTADSFISEHKKLMDYVINKSFKTDADFSQARSIIKNFEPWFDTYKIASDNLYEAIKKYYEESLPPKPSQLRVRNAEKELSLTTDLMDTWGDELYNGDNSHNISYDQQMRDMNTAGIAKDSLYLYPLYGYRTLSNGAYPHSRYLSFYELMQSTIYWYVKNKYQYPVYMKKEDINYNEYVYRYNSVIEYYNMFIECADGKKLCENMDYSMKMAADIGVDTNQNVLLQKPRLPFRFAYVEIPEEILPVQKTDTAETEHQLMINKAAPHHMVFLLDVSASMHEEGKLDLLKTGARYLVKLQRETDHISVISFSTHAHRLLVNTSCGEKTTIYKKLDQLEAGGATNVNAGIQNAFNIADSSRTVSGKNKILLVTDGSFTLDDATNKLLKSFKKEKIELCIFLVGNAHDKKIIDGFVALCKKAHGRFYQVDKKNLEDILVKEASD